MRADAVKVSLQVATEVDDLPDESEFSAWVNAAAAGGEFSGAVTGADSLVTIRVAGEQESSTLNKKYRNVNKATNVLAFPAAEFALEAYGEDIELGDLIICYSVVVSEAQDQSKSLLAHLAHMTVHGTLHLLGYDHLEAAEAEAMEALEIRIMAALGFPDPYQLNRGI